MLMSLLGLFLLKLEAGLISLMLMLLLLLLVLLQVQKQVLEVLCRQGVSREIEAEIFIRHLS